jgi:RecA/RadA recombinase
MSDRLQSNAMDVVVVDSVAALATKAELEGDMGAHQIGGQARLMSQAPLFLPLCLLLYCICAISLSLSL